MAVAESYAQLASERGLARAEGFAPGPVTPLLTKGGAIGEAHVGPLNGETEGVIGTYSYGRFHYNVVFARIPESQPFVPRLFCERKGRITDDTHYGFEVRNSRLWTESGELNERFKVTVSPFQDDNWLRQLFIPSFIDWLGQGSPADLSFELAYGSLLCSVESDQLDAAELEALWAAGATVAGRVHEESNE